MVGERITLVAALQERVGQEVGGGAPRWDCFAARKKNSLTRLERAVFRQPDFDDDSGSRGTASRA